MTRRTILIGVTAAPLLAAAAQAAVAAPVRAREPAVPPRATYRMHVTLYGAYDNDPPGSADIAYPVLHDRAGGTGTYDDPVTFATDRAELPAGTRIYYPYLKKYFVMEDYCAACHRDWTGHGPDGGPHYRHVDLWAGNSSDSAITACENSLTSRGRVPVVVSPPPDEPVDTTPIFDSATLVCYSPRRPAPGAGDRCPAAPPTEAAGQCAAGSRGLRTGPRPRRR